MNPPNPVVVARHETGLGVLGYASLLKVHKALVQYAEQGCYRKIPTCYLTSPNSGVTVRDLPAYTAFRLAKRRQFPVDLFPVDPLPPVELFTHLGLRPYSFACTFCVQPVESQKLLRQPRRLPINVTEALLQVGLTFSWVQKFEELCRGTQ